MHILILTFTAVYTMHITNLSPIQRIAVAEKYRPIYEKQAKERQATSTGGVKPQLTPNLVEAEKTNNRSENETNSKLAKIANVGKETYRQAKRVLDSNNDDLKQRVLSGETSISAGYKQGGNRKSNCQVGILKLSDIAKQLGTSERNLQRAISIERNLTEPMKQLLDDGVISKTVASDDEVLLDLLESNIRRRGEIGGSAKKVGKRIKELERLYGIKVGKPNYEKNSQLKTQEQLASDLEMDVRTLQNYKLLADMIPELKENVAQEKCEKLFWTN